MNTHCTLTKTDITIFKDLCAKIKKNEILTEEIRISHEK